MGYAFAVSPCHLCDNIFTYNPHKVPSIKDADGRLQPICEHCLKTFQKYQQEKGMPIWPDALPGAYEPMDESEL